MDIQAYNDPTQGWMVGETRVFPLHAYTTPAAWLRHFEATFPQKAIVMREYAAEHGWTPLVYVLRWTPACLDWLRKNGEPNAERNSAPTREVKP